VLLLGQLVRDRAWIFLPQRGRYVVPLGLIISMNFPQKLKFNEKA